MNVHAIIMAGGKGTRISSISGRIPKSMMDICGKPLLERQLEVLKRQGIEQITMIIGFLSDKIKNHFADGKKFGVEISYIEEKEPLGTAGGLFYIDRSDKTPLLIINGDILFDISFTKMLTWHISKKSDITLFTHPNNHPFDSAVINTDSADRIIKWYNKEEEKLDCKNRVNAGVHILEPTVLNIFDDLREPIKLDLDRDIIKPGLMKYDVYAYNSPEYVKDMGTPSRYRSVCEDLRGGLVSSRNLEKKQKAIFLDRDGTINEHLGFVKTPDELILRIGSSDGVREINAMGYLAIVITNQPVIARGDCTLEELGCIHDRMETLLGNDGAFVDDIYYCPHHPHKGFQGERMEYKIDCSCRKPMPGMIFQAAEKYNIDLSKSWMIGDSESDIETGKRAGCKTFLIHKEESLFEAVKKIKVQE